MRGKLIEYIDHGRFICAFVVEDAGKRLKLINQNGREVNLPQARVIHQSQVSHSADGSRDELLKILKSTDEKRQVMTDSVHLEEIWELASEESDTIFDPSFLTELSFGEDATDDHVAAFMRCVFEDKLFFKYKEGKIIVHPAEIVEQLRIRQEKERQHEAILTVGATELKRIWDGGEVGDWPERDMCFKLVQDFYLNGSDAPESAMARELLKKAELTKPHDVFHLMVKAGIWDENENIGLLKREIPVSFSQEVIGAIDFAEPDGDALCADGRRDLRDLPLLTIDGESTRDHDDALHIEKRGDNYLVGIHISDVANYIKPGSVLFEEAVKRVTSIYFPDSIVPMLPREVSEGVCSLFAGKDRAAMSFMVLLSPAGEMLEFEIVPSVVNVKRQLTYTDADELIDKDEDLKILTTLSKHLRQRRIDAGAVLLPIPDVNIRIDQQGKIDVSLMDVDTPTRTLVAEFMVLANTVAAEYVSGHQAPGLFRTQDEPHQRILHGFEKDLFLNFRQRKQLKPGNIMTTPKFHSGVGVMQYTTITSPIRRFFDLVMQLQINNLVTGKGILFTDERMKDFIAAITTTQSKVNLARRLRHRYWLLKYLEPKVGDHVDALIVNKGPKRVNVVLMDCLLDGDLPPNQAITAKPGDIGQVKIARVSPLDGILRLEW